MPPWDKYAAPESSPPPGPWAKYAAPGPQTAPPQTVQDRVKNQMGLKDYRQRGTILPIGENEDKSLELAWPQLAVDLMQAFALPQHAAEGGAYTPTDALGTAAVMSPVSAATRAGERMIPGLSTSHQPAKPKIPTAVELKSAADAGYKQAGDMGVDYTSSSVKNFADNAAQILDSEGFIGELAPKTAALLRQLREPPDDSVASLQSLDAFRKRLNDIAGSPDKTEASAANKVIRGLDEFLQANDPSSLVVGAPAATRGGAANLPGLNGASAQSAEETARVASTALSDARGNAAARFRSDRLTGVEEAAELRAAAANSGQNLGNNLRSRLASLLLSDKQSRGFSETELDAIRQVVDGTATTNTLRRVSNWLGGGGGLGQTLLAALGAGAGSTTGVPLVAALGAAAPIAVGTGTRSLANNLTKRQLSKVDEMVRSRSPLYRSRVENPGMEVRVPETRVALLRALLAAQSQPPQATNQIPYDSPLAKALRAGTAM